MNKKTVAFLFVLFFITQSNSVSALETQRRALFISVIQEPQVLSSRQSIEDLVTFAKNSNVDTLFVQIYRENKTWFPSRVGDPSPYEDCLKKLSEDPLALLIKEAHESGVEVHAWLNLLSIGSNENAPLLKKYGTKILTRNLKEKKSRDDYKVDGQFFLEPGDPRVRQALSNIVGEVLKTYPTLDGIQFDYIRYPDVEPSYGYTAVNIERFKRATGQKNIDEESAVWKDWKREQVTGLLQGLAKKARTLCPKIQVSTTGLVPFSRADLEAYQDWRFWLKSGLVDFVTLMAYSSSLQEFEKYIRDARDKVGTLHKINIAVGAYKLLDSPEVFKQEMDVCEASGSRGCVIFHYGNLIEKPELKGTLLNES